MSWITYFFKTFIPEVKVELSKVTFPSRDEVVGTTIVVLVTSFIFAFYLWFADIIILKVYQQIFNWTTRVLG